MGYTKEMGDAISVEVVLAQFPTVVLQQKRIEITSLLFLFLASCHYLHLSSREA